MSGIDDLLAESNDWWASAWRRAQGIADHGLGEAVKTYYVFYLPVGIVVLISIGTIGGMLALGGALTDWSSYLLFGFFLTLLGALIGGLIYNAKRVRPAADLGRIDVLFSLQEHEQKHVRRQILARSRLTSNTLPSLEGLQCNCERTLPRSSSWHPRSCSRQEPYLVVDGPFRLRLCRLYGLSGARISAGRSIPHPDRRPSIRRQGRVVQGDIVPVGDETRMRSFASSRTKVLRSGFAYGHLEGAIRQFALGRRLTK